MITFIQQSKILCLQTPLFTIAQNRKPPNICQQVICKQIVRDAYNGILLCCFKEQSAATGIVSESQKCGGKDTDSLYRSRNCTPLGTGELTTRTQSSFLGWWNQ